jgi:DNA/RNA endonuclease YhcR with UshA esterase domain
VERERRWIKDIAGKGIIVDEAYVVKRKDPPRRDRRGNSFFSIHVSDASGEIRVNYWGGSDEGAVRRVFDGVREGAVVRVRGTSDQFNDVTVVQVNLSNGDLVQEVKEGEYDLANFVAC